MTRKHFQRIADGIRYVASDPTMDERTIRAMVNELCNAGSALNPNFNRAKFESACGLDVTQ